MSSFVTEAIVESILSVRESFDRRVPLGQLEDLGWRRDPDGWMILEITDTVSLQACDDRDGNVSMEVWVDDWTFGSVTDVRIFVDSDGPALAIYIDDGSRLVYPIVLDDMEVCS